MTRFEFQAESRQQLKRDLDAGQLRIRWRNSRRKKERQFETEPGAPRSILLGEVTIVIEQLGGNGARTRLADISLAEVTVIEISRCDPDDGFWPTIVWVRGEGEESTDDGGWGWFHTPLRLVREEK